MTKTIYDYNRGDYEQFNTKLKFFYHEHFLPPFASRTVNANQILFKKKKKELVDQFIPLISISNDKTNPRFTKQLSTLRNKKKCLYNTVKCHVSACYHEKYKACLQEYCKALGATKIIRRTCPHLSKIILKNSCK